MLSKSRGILFVGAAALMVATSASAQQGRRTGSVSSTRIPVSKEPAPAPPPPETPPPAPAPAPLPPPPPPAPPPCTGPRSVTLTGVDLTILQGFSDANIVAHMLNTDTLEIELGFAAMSRAENLDVRQYGGMLLTDHKNDMPRIRHVERDHHIGNEVNPADASSQNLAAALEGLRTHTPVCAGWDQTFIAEQLQFHFKELQALRLWEKSAHKEDLRDRMEIMIPIEQRHFDQAQQLAKSLGISVSGGGSP